jgi:hypothetical protein
MRAVVGRFLHNMMPKSRVDNQSLFKRLQATKAKCIAQNQLRILMILLLGFSGIPQLSLEEAPEGPLLMGYLLLLVSSQTTRLHVGCSSCPSSQTKTVIPRCLQGREHLPHFEQATEDRKKHTTSTTGCPRPILGHPQQGLVDPTGASGVRPKKR